MIAQRPESHHLLIGFHDWDAIALEKSSGTTVNSITADRHCSLGNAGVYGDNLVEVEKIEEQAGGRLGLPVAVRHPRQQVDELPVEVVHLT